MARRGQGEGSIYQRKDGRWTATISLGRGKRQSFYGKTRGEVQKLLTAALRSQDQGLAVASSKKPLGAYLEEWLTTIDVRPKTKTSYEYIVRRLITPEIGRVPLDQLSPGDVEGMLKKAAARGLSSSTRVHMRGVLRRALARAVKHELVVRNVAALADAPTLIHKAMTPLNPTEAKRFRDAARGDQLEALWVLAITSGLREGELLGLQWGDLDLDSGSVSVERQLQRFDGKLQLVALKTARSRRRNRLPQIAITTLRDHLASQIASGRPPLPSGLVFTSRTGTPLEPRNVVRRFKALLQRGNLPGIRFHDLRHSAASLLIAEGVPPKTIMDVLGHSSITLTMNVYGHLFDEARQEAATAMDRAFS